MNNYFFCILILNLYDMIQHFTIKKFRSTKSKEHNKKADARKMYMYGSICLWSLLLVVFCLNCRMCYVHWICADSGSKLQYPWVMCLCVCLSVPSQKTRFLVDWRLLVKECIASIGIPLDFFRFLIFDLFSVLNFCLGISALCKPAYCA